MDCLESKKKKRRGLFVSIFVAFRERERAVEQISSGASKCHILLLFPSFFVWVVGSSSFLSLLKKRRKRRRVATHKLKKKRER